MSFVVVGFFFFDFLGRYIFVSYTLFQIVCFILSLSPSFILYENFSVKPAAVHILAKRAFVSADKTYDIECKSSGSKPAAVITWWRGTKQIKRPVRNVSSIRCAMEFKLVAAWQAYINILTHFGALGKISETKFQFK